MDVGLSPGPGYNGQFEANFGAISETLYYNPSAGTVREVGSIAVSPSSGTFNMQTYGFPSTPVGSASLTVGNNGSVPFDITFSGLTGGLGLAGVGGDIVVPISGSGTYEGQAFSGSWDVDLPLEMDITSASSSTLGFTEYSGFAPGSFSEVDGQTVLANGLMDGAGGDGTIGYMWNLDPDAQAVPDHATSLGLLGLALAPLAVLRRRFNSLRPVPGRVAR